MLLDCDTGLQQQQIGFLQAEQVEAIRRLPQRHPLHRQHVLIGELVIEHDCIDVFVHTGSSGLAAGTGPQPVFYALGGTARVICRTSGPMATQALRISASRLSTSAMKAGLLSALARSSWRIMYSYRSLRFCAIAPPRTMSRQPRSSATRLMQLCSSFAFRTTSPRSMQPRAVVMRSTAPSINISTRPCGSALATPPCTETLW